MGNSGFETCQLARKTPGFLIEFNIVSVKRFLSLVIVGVDEKDKGGVKIRNVRSQTEVSVL